MNGHDVRFAVIDEISQQASEAWGMGCAQVAFDFMRVSIPARSVPAMQVEEVVATATVAEGSVGNQVNASDVDDSDAVGHSVRQWGSGNKRQRRGSRGARGRGRGMRGNYSGEMDRDGMTARRGMKRQS